MKFAFIHIYTRFRKALYVHNMHDDISVYIASAEHYFAARTTILLLWWSMTMTIRRRNHPHSAYNAVYCYTYGSFLYLCTAPNARDKELNLLSFRWACTRDTSSYLCRITHMKRLSFFPIGNVNKLSKTNILVHWIDADVFIVCSTAFLSMYCIGIGNLIRWSVAMSKIRQISY